MRSISIIAVALLLTSTVAFASGSTERQIHLKDGSVVHIDQSGAMRMMDAQGQIIEMKDGEPMEAMDGTVIMMRNNALWKRLHQGSRNPKLH